LYARALAFRLACATQARFEKGAGRALRAARPGQGAAGPGQGAHQQHLQDVAHGGAHGGALGRRTAGGAGAPRGRGAGAQRGQRGRVVGRRAEQRLHRRLVAEQALEEGERVRGQRVHGAVRRRPARRVARQRRLELAQRGARLGAQRGAQRDHVAQHPPARAAGQHAPQRARGRLQVLLHVKQPEHLLRRAPRARHARARLRAARRAGSAPLIARRLSAAPVSGTRETWACKLEPGARLRQRRQRPRDDLRERGLGMRRGPDRRGRAVLRKRGGDQLAQAQDPGLDAALQQRPGHARRVLARRRRGHQVRHRALRHAAPHLPPGCPRRRRASPSVIRPAGRAHAHLAVHPEAGGLRVAQHGLGQRAQPRGHHAGQHLLDLLLALLRPWRRARASADARGDRSGRVLPPAGTRAGCAPACGVSRPPRLGEDVADSEPAAIIGGAAPDECCRSVAVKSSSASRSASARSAVALLSAPSAVASDLAPGSTLTQMPGSQGPGWRARRCDHQGAARRTCAATGR